MTSEKIIMSEHKPRQVVSKGVVRSRQRSRQAASKRIVKSIQVGSKLATMGKYYNAFPLRQLMI